MNGSKILAGHLQPNYNVYSALLFILIFNISCKPGDGKQLGKNEDNHYDIENNELKQLPSDFQKFYREFHADSTFQMNHIDFPLQGIPDQADPDDIKNNEYYFTADQWSLHKEFDLSKFKMSYLQIGDVLIEERIVEKQHQLMVIRRFAKNARGWRLIYYAGVNKYKTRE